jgi:hypothetical protein
MKNPPEIKILIAGDELISPEVRNQLEQLVLSAGGIKSVTKSDENKLAGNCVVAMRKHVKDLTAERMVITRRFDDAKKIVMDFFAEHNKPLEDEIDRLQKLGNNYIEDQQRKVAAQEKKQREEFEAAQRAQFALDEAARKAAESGSIAQQMVANRKLEAAKANVQTIIAAPKPEMTKAKGQTTKQVLRHEVTDILALVKARPDLCKIEAKASAINSTCHPNLPIPGLRLWFETETTYTTR